MIASKTRYNRQKLDSYLTWLSSPDLRSLFNSVMTHVNIISRYFRKRNTALYMYIVGYRFVFYPRNC